MKDLYNGLIREFIIEVHPPSVGLVVQLAMGNRVQDSVMQGWNAAYQTHKQFTISPLFAGTT